MARFRLNLDRATINETCTDKDRHCFEWVAANGNDCESVAYVKTSCRKTCVECGTPDKRFDVRNMPDELRPIGFLLGVWRSEAGGKAIFPTIPVFTYGEEISISLPNKGMKGLKALNYTAFAWDINNRQELHAEYGYLAMKPHSKQIALTTVMDNGQHCIQQLILTLLIAVLFGTVMIREWRLLDSTTFEARLFMETLTHRMQMHTSIIYKKIYPL
ncbi:unnamed protein product [Anisakis simplex]|uniref:ShKT domain-containing protein n=1 Tax=Anisakis simplex TaxID=6269 RepID=A0A0M3JTZ9_ANISI|nr:unnamed protein product [Anisakis simplex]